MSKDWVVRTPKGSVSWLLQRRAVVVGLLLLLMNLAVVVISTGLGEMKLSPWSVMQALFGQGDPMHEFVIMELRLPRMIVALLVGMALAGSGAIFQGMIRNPLASPDYTGVTGGASVAAVGFLVLFTDPVDNALTISVRWLPFAAFLGAAAAAVLVYILSWRKGVTPTRLVLVGIGLTQGFNALTTMLMLSGPLIIATQSKIWLTGSVYGSSWTSVKVLLPWIGIVLPLAWILSRRLNALELGDSIAQGIGSRVQRDRILLLLVSAALAAGAVSFGGAISFVGLIAPHIARKLVGASFGALLPISALTGGLLVLTADLIGRTAFAPLDVPAGVFTATIGAPYLIYLLYRQRKV